LLLASHGVVDIECRSHDGQKTRLDVKKTLAKVKSKQMKTQQTLRSPTSPTSPFDKTVAVARSLTAPANQMLIASKVLAVSVLCLALWPSANSQAQTTIQLPSITTTPPNPTGSLIPNPSAPKSITTITQQAMRLLKEGKPDLALEGIDKGLEISPRDAQLLFLRGVALADLKKTDSAILIFTTLTQEFPELPEPYNNLAVLYATEGDLDKAKGALEAAIKALPNYALAHENLGDLYLQLAARQFDRAAKANPKSPFAARKLVLARDWVNAVAQLNVQ
jgi:Flp pilus assembly protein TadD